MIGLDILKAGNGDSFLLSWHYQDKKYNVLIDGGLSKTYKSGNKSGPLLKALKNIKKKQEKINLLILTHVDNDHIGGILSGFSEGELLRDLTEEVWFNSGVIIDKYFEREVDCSHYLELKRKINSVNNKGTSIKQGEKFEEILNDLNIWNQNLIFSGMQLKRFGANFEILSPDLKKLEKLLIKWEKESERKKTSVINDYKISIDDLILDDSFEGDKSIHNGSSIAFLFEFSGKKILFLGDSHEDILIESIKKLKNDNREISKDNPLVLDAVKISHHGSKLNTSIELLNLIDTKNFIISTDGSCHGLPNKKTISRIIRVKPNANLYFNYINLVDRIFDKNEKRKLLEEGINFIDCNNVFEL